MAIQIPTPDTPNSLQNVTLNGKSYIIENSYNSRYDTWSVSVSERSGTVLVNGEKVTPLKDILSRYDRTDTLGGILFIASDNPDEKVTRDNYGLNKTHTLTYALFSEVEALTNV